MNAEPHRRASPIRSISAVLVSYNEAANLTQVIEGTLDALLDVVPSFEVIVVDDGSTDATRRIANELASSHPEVRVIHLAKQQGYGSALRAGLAAATKQYVFILDANRRYNPADLDRLVKWDDAYDVVAGYRVRRIDSAPRRFVGVLYRLAARVIFGLKYRDVNCGFKLVRASLLQGMALHAKSTAVATEMLYRAGQQGALVREVAVRHYSRPTAAASSIVRFRAAMRVARELLVFRRTLMQERTLAAAVRARIPVEAGVNGTSGSPDGSSPSDGDGTSKGPPNGEERRGARQDGTAGAVSDSIGPVAPPAATSEPDISNQESHQV